MLLHIEKIFDPTVRVVNARPIFMNFLLGDCILVMIIVQSMFFVIHPTITDIQPSHESYLLINDHHLLMMRPIRRNGSLIGMSQDFDIRGDRL